MNRLLKNKLGELTTWIDHYFLKNYKPKRNDSIPFSVTYNSVLPNIKEIINKHWHVLNIDSSFKEIFNSSQLMIAFCKNTNLKQLIGTNTKRNNQNFSHIHKQQPQINLPMLHQSIALLPTSSHNNNIYKHSNQRDLYNSSASHLP